MDKIESLIAELRRRATISGAVAGSNVQIFTRAADALSRLTSAPGEPSEEALQAFIKEWFRWETYGQDVARNALRKAYAIDGVRPAPAPSTPPAAPVECPNCGQTFGGKAPVVPSADGKAVPDGVALMGDVLGPNMSTPPRATDHAAAGRSGVAAPDVVAAVETERDDNTEMLRQFAADNRAFYEEWRTEFARRVEESANSARGEG